MDSALANSIEWSGLWTWFLLFVRFTGLFQTLPGLGTEEIPIPFRTTIALVLAAVVAMTGAHALMPANLAEGGLMIGTEYVLGWILGVVPAFVLSSLAVSGQVTSAAIGLGQASLIDPSIGEHVSVLARIQSMIGTIIFLSIDGHHTILRAASFIAEDVGVGRFRPDAATALQLAERFSESFELAVVIAAPILITILVTQFLLGLLTKFVPQVNVFIISLPLTIGIGLFICAYTMPSLGSHAVTEFTRSEEIAARLISNR